VDKLTRACIQTRFKPDSSRPRNEIRVILCTYPRDVCVLRGPGVFSGSSEIPPRDRRLGARLAAGIIFAAEESISRCILKKKYIRGEGDTGRDRRFRAVTYSPGVR